jgi:hypothetical protein
MVIKEIGIPAFPFIEVNHVLSDIPINRNQGLTLDDSNFFGLVSNCEPFRSVGHGSELPHKPVEFGIVALGVVRAIASD